MPAAVKTVSIRDFGAAEGNTAAENAAAIQQAIDEARVRGIPSRVVVPPGTFSTGTLRLRSHVEDVSHLTLSGSSLPATIRGEIPANGASVKCGILNVLASDVGGWLGGGLAFIVVVK